MNEVYEKVMACVNYVRTKTDFVPEIAVVLGSGLGDYAKEIVVEAEIPYADIPGFPVSTVQGHAGQFILGYVNGVPVVCMKGRVHYYEGYSMSDVVLPIRVMKLLGAKILFLTNASGGIGEQFRAGDFMLITDHIACFVPNPLVGRNIEELGTRFPDMTAVYDAKLQEQIKEAAADNGIVLQEGVYAQLTGPSFESPAEIRMLRTLGADAVGMSTVVEAIAANHMGMRICGVSCVCNQAAGMTKQPLTHTEVQAAADKAAPLFEKLLTQSIQKMHTEAEREAAADAGTID